MTSADGPSGDQSLTWGDDGSLSSVTDTGGTSPGTTSDYYDADGTLIEQDGPSGKTLFLPWEELQVSSAGKASGTRFYSIGGTEIAARTSAGHISYLLGDQEGTSTLAIDSSSLDPTWRYYDPFGNTVGAAASSWPGLQGFQDGTLDQDTGLENIGAREYDPAAAVFTSPDPVLTPSNPQDLNPYAYAGDSAPSAEDPTGQFYLIAGTGGDVGSTSATGGLTLNPTAVGRATSSSGGESSSGTSDVPADCPSVVAKYPGLQVLASLPPVVQEAYIRSVEQGLASYQLPRISTLAQFSELESLYSFCDTGRGGYTKSVCGRLLGHSIQKDYFGMAAAITGGGFGGAVAGPGNGGLRRRRRGKG